MKNLILIVFYVLPYAIIFAIACTYILMQIGKKNISETPKNHMLFIYRRKLCQTLKSQQNERSN